MANRESPTFNTIYAITSLDKENATTTDGTTGAICSLGGMSVAKDLYVGGDVVLSGQFRPPATQSGTFIPTLSATNTTFTPTLSTGYYTTLGQVILFQISMTGAFTTVTTSANPVTITNIPFTNSYGTTASISGAISSLDNVGTKGFPDSTLPYTLSMPTASTIGLFSGDDPVTTSVGATQQYQIIFNGSYVNTTLPNQWFPTLTFSGDGRITYSNVFGKYNLDDVIVTTQAVIQGTVTTGAYQNASITGLPFYVAAFGSGACAGDTSIPANFLPGYFTNPNIDSTTAQVSVSRYSGTPVYPTGIPLKAYFDSSAINLSTTMFYFQSAGTSYTAPSLSATSTSFSYSTQTAHKFISGDVTYCRFQLEGTYQMAAQVESPISIIGMTPSATTSSYLIGTGITSPDSYFDSPQTYFYGTAPFVINAQGTTGYLFASNNGIQTPTQISASTTLALPTYPFTLKGCLAYFSGAGTSWTPVPVGLGAVPASFTQIIATGRYQVTGNKVCAEFTIGGTYMQGLGSNPLTITGLPFDTNTSQLLGCGACSGDTYVQTNGLSNNIEGYTVSIRNNVLEIYCSFKNGNVLYPVGLSTGFTPLNYRISAFITYLIN